MTLTWQGMCWGCTVSRETPLDRHSNPWPSEFDVSVQYEVEYTRKYCDGETARTKILKDLQVFSLPEHEKWQIYVRPPR
jgi:hypothetical protein